MSQETVILQHLKRGTITPLQAMREYQIMRLAARINDLRHKGHKIGTEMVKNGRKRYARYWLEGGV